MTDSVSEADGPAPTVRAVTVVAPDGEGRSDTEIKRSRFLAIARRVRDTAEAEAAVAAARATDPDARHHCWAYVLGADPAHRTARSSDDGEPGGTAGVPILQVVTQRDVTDVVVVVTRWFGGVKLGAGGLVRAYSGAAAAALDDARLVERVRLDVLDLPLDHADAGRVEAELRRRDVEILGVHYGAQACLSIAYPDGAALHRIVAEVTGGSAVARDAGHRWPDPD